MTSWTTVNAAWMGAKSAIDGLLAAETHAADAELARQRAALDARQAQRLAAAHTVGPVAVAAAQAITAFENFRFGQKVATAQAAKARATAGIHKTSAGLQAKIAALYEVGANTTQACADLSAKWKAIAASVDELGQDIDTNGQDPGWTTGGASDDVYRSLVKRMVEANRSFKERSEAFSKATMDVSVGQADTYAAAAGNLQAASADVAGQTGQAVQFAAAEMWCHGCFEIIRKYDGALASAAAVGIPDSAPVGPYMSSGGNPMANVLNGVVNQARQRGGTIGRELSSTIDSLPQEWPRRNDGGDSSAE